MAYTIQSFERQIRKEVPLTQTTEVNAISHNWTMHYQSHRWIEPILSSLRINDWRVSLSRNDLITTTNPQERLVKILFWGYPGVFRNPDYLNRILSNIDTIIDYLPAYDSKLNQRQFLLLYERLSSINGIQESTISKILCFWKIKIASSEAVIVDQFVLECRFLFDEFWNIKVSQRSSEDYLKVIKKINHIARNISVEPQQLELFLFKCGKAVKETRRLLYRSLLLYSGFAKAEADNEQE